MAMDFTAARIKMVDTQVRTTDVTDRDILRAFLNVPREPFVPEERRALTYMGASIPLGEGRMLMEPSPLAKLLQLGQVIEAQHALDVGAGTGYGSALMAYLGCKVTALEENPVLARRAREALAETGFDAVEVVEAPLAGGHKANAPYDLVVFEGSVDEIPDLFFDQLAERGHLVAVIGRGNAAMAKLYVKDGPVVSDRFGFNCSLHPLPGFQRAPSFVF